MKKIDPYPLPESITSLFEQPFYSKKKKKRALKEAVRQGLLSEDEGEANMKAIEAYEASVRMSGGA